MATRPPLIIWRDDNPNTDPIIKVLHAAQVYKEKFGNEPNELHVPPQFPIHTREQLAERFTVKIDVPKFFSSEIWIGRSDNGNARHIVQLDAAVG